MLRRGIAIICRNPEEYNALLHIVSREGYGWIGGKRLNHYAYNQPIRLSFNDTYRKDSCMSRCENLEYQLNPGITEVYEASDFLHNIIISMRLKGE